MKVTGDCSRVESARLMVTRKLEQYGYADSVIIAVLGISESSFYRLISGHYLKRRSPKKESNGDRLIAKSLAIAVLIVEGYSAAEITSSIVASQSDVYRKAKEIHVQLGRYSEGEKKRIAHILSTRLDDWEPQYVREWKERKRRERWVRRKSFSSGG